MKISHLRKIQPLLFMQSMPAFCDKIRQMLQKYFLRLQKRQRHRLVFLSQPSHGGSEVTLGTPSGSIVTPKDTLRSPLGDCALWWHPAYSPCGCPSILDVLISLYSPTPHSLAIDIHQLTSVNTSIRTRKYTGLKCLSLHTTVLHSPYVLRLFPSKDDSLRYEFEKKILKSQVSQNKSCISP